MVDLYDVAAKLDADQRLKVVYRFPVRSADGEVDYETREGKLLDIAEEAKLLYVSDRGEVVWVKLEEVLSVAPEG